MIDCGLFQGLKDLRLLNWEQMPVAPSEISHIILTHAHLDHVGYLPRLVRQGFSGKIYCSDPTLEIATIILLDSAKIQEEDAEYANRKGFTRHKPAEPLYDLKDAKQSIRLLKSAPLDKWFQIGDNIRFRLKYNGHILGATFAEIDIDNKRLVFSGDIGRKQDLMLYPPDRPSQADYIIMESTYGDRHHPEESTPIIFRDLINKAYAKKGTIIIPSFTVDRAQDLIWILYDLKKKKQIPDIDIYLDSPMGTNVSRVFCKYDGWHKLGMDVFDKAYSTVKNVRSVEDTYRISRDQKPKIVIAGSGMLNGGRVLHYLKDHVSNPDSTIILSGYQAEGTRGRHLSNGTREIKIHGEYYKVLARVEAIHTLSSHADQDDLLDWLSAIKKKPAAVFLAHGEAHAADALRVKIKDTFKWQCSVPRLMETYPLF